MKICSLWSCNKYYLNYTYVSIQSFINVNKWFIDNENDIIIVISDPISNDDINNAKKIYKNIKFIYSPINENNKWYLLEKKFREHIGEHALNSNHHNWKNYFCLFNRFICLDLLSNYEYIIQQETDIFHRKSIKCLFDNKYPIVNCQMASDIREDLLIDDDKLLIPHYELHKLSKYKKPIFGQIGLTIFHNSVSKYLNYENMLNIVENNKFPWIFTTNFDEECFNICCNILKLDNIYYYINLKYINYIEDNNNDIISYKDTYYKNSEILFDHYIVKPWQNIHNKYFTDWNKIYKKLIK